MKKLLTILLLLITSQIYSQQAKYQTPQELIDSTYKIMSFNAGSSPDWDNMKNLFHVDAQIALRITKTKIKTTNRDGFIDLWKQDIKSMKLNETGITEKKEIERYYIAGDIATAYVIYNVSIPEKKMPPQLGLDCFQLIKQQNRWYIFSIINEVLRPGVEPPDMMKSDFNNYLNKLKNNQNQ